MAKSNTGSGLWSQLLSTSLYKRNQGRLTRQLTALGLGAVLAFGLWQLSQGPLASYGANLRVGVPLAIAVLGGWCIFRLVHYPRFADFLIAVEAEMDKVSWPSRNDLRQATIVVLGTMFLLGFLLFVYDYFWKWFFRLIGFLRF